MIRKLYEDAKAGIDTRQNLSRLRQEIKDDRKRNDLFELVEDDMDSMRRFLLSDDAKTRKNAALLMGELDMSDFAQDLMEAYQKEEQLFVRPAFLEALKNYDIGKSLLFFKEQAKALQNTQLTEENKKHISEELKQLTELIVSVEGIVRHKFTGFGPLKEPVECILLTNRLHREITEAQVVKEAERRAEKDGGASEEIKRIPFKGGVRFRTGELRFLRNIRTFSEILFVIPGFAASDFKPEAAARAVADSKIMNLLERLHTGGKRSEGEGPFYFRVELKSGLDLEQKSRFAKRFSAELERLTDRRLVNLTSDYEIELRLIESKDGKLNALLKLYTMEDKRFDYFKSHTASSIKPVNAALLAELAKEYLKPDARVLDPFCGVGTMLIERQKTVKADTSYGIDINGEALEGAKRNTEAAGQVIHYINRDFFTFRHEYLFDEIFTDMPFAMGERGLPDIERIYQRFFAQAKEVLAQEGRIIMFSRNTDYAQKYAKRTGYRLMARYLIAEGTPKTQESALLIFGADKIV